MKKSILLVSVLLLLGITSYSQTSPVKIIDLSVSPGIKADSIQIDSTDLIVNFKIKNSNQASVVYFLFGSTADSGDILSVNGTFSNQSGTIYLTTSGHQNPVADYSAQAYISLNNQQNAAFNFLTVYVQDINGLITDKLYFHK